MAMLAKQERLRMSERTKEGLQRASRAGTLERPRIDANIKRLEFCRGRAYLCMGSRPKQI
jgi:DNA invertase Pin-like site-specific DNA recombinase